MRAREAFERLELGPSDELIVADNTREGVASGAVRRARDRRPRAPAGVLVLRPQRRGRRATGDWLLFVDADCVPEPDLIDRYFDEPIGERAGAVAGGIIGVTEQDSLLARYARDRNFLDQAEGMHGSAGVAAATGNLLIRRDTFDELGGFADGIRSAGDVDFCWRMREAGWDLEQRPAARVEHHHREHLGSFLAMIARYGAGSRWLNERHPGAAPRWPLVHGLVGSAWDVSGHLLRGQLEPATFRALDGLGLIAHNVGYRAGNEV